jgi:hypothetical protein
MSETVWGSVLQRENTSAWVNGKKKDYYSRASNRTNGECAGHAGVPEVHQIGSQRTREKVSGAAMVTLDALRQTIDYNEKRFSL